MAAIAQSNPYDVFIRKIGWSVGLESTYERVLDLVKLYVRDREITPLTWRRLVEDKEYGWGLKNDHIADFFSALHLIRRQKNEIQILPCLDALALVYVQLDSENAYRVAQKLILGSEFVLSDGDIFLNLLAGKFDRVLCETFLRKMILTKREKILKVVKAPQLMVKVVKGISIDVQVTNIGGAGAGKSLSQQKRFTPLSPRTEALSQRVDPLKVDISDDYFRKVMGRRKDWAASLELVGKDGALNATADGLLQAIAELNGYQCAGSEPMVCWPLDFELRRIHLSPEILGIPSITLWSHICAMRKGFGLDACGYASNSSEVETEVLNLLREMCMQFRKFNPKRSLLRKEVPISTFLHAATAFYVSMEKPLPLIREIVERFGMSPDSDVIFRRSKNFEATLSLKA